MFNESCFKFYGIETGKEKQLVLDILNLCNDKNVSDVKLALNMVQNVIDRIAVVRVSARHQE